jgi:hypothetical protein
MRRVRHLHLLDSHVVAIAAPYPDDRLEEPEPILMAVLSAVVIAAAVIGAALGQLGVF